MEVGNFLLVKLRTLLVTRLLHQLTFATAAPFPLISRDTLDMIWTGHMGLKVKQQYWTEGDLLQAIEQVGSNLRR